MNQNRWRQIEDIYSAALEMSAAERERFLAEKCAGDADLRAEIASLLTSFENGDDFLKEPDFDLGLKLLTKPSHALRSEQNFGNHTILKFLGKGGMGEVYLAQDARLGRLVALKVLPAELAANAERIRRFEHEAKAASALNHPNILTIHEIGETEGWHFIASEFVEGKTLRERLKDKKPFTRREIVEIAMQIAAALNAAHQSGIVHRDIKPENVMLREDGLVKVLDFGLAKLAEKPEIGKQNGNFLTTNPGIVMGTFTYMSPEQARGQRVDARSDVWSLGVVLYEMVEGRLPFAGDTTSDIIAAILTSEPTFSANALPEAKSELRQIISKTLRKNPADRYQFALEVTADLKKVSLDSDFLTTQITDIGNKQTGDVLNTAAFSDAAKFPSQTQKTQKKGISKTAVAFAAFLAVFIGCSYVIYKYSGFFDNFRRSREPMKISRISDTGKTVTAAISPDGKYVVHAVAEAGKQSIWIRHLATNSNVQLIEPKKADYPALTFSKDGNYIYYNQNGNELYQIPVLGGDSRKILDRVHSAISFSPDGRQFTFSRRLASDETGLIIVNADGSEERIVTTRTKPVFFEGAAWSPDGKTIAIPAGSGGENRTINIALVPIAGGAETLISTQKWRAIRQPEWLSDGSGLIAPATISGSDALQIWFFPASGGEARQITNDLNNYGEVSLTADSSALVTIQFEQRTNIWLLPQGKADEARLVSNNVRALYRFLSVAPDGKILYPSQENGNGNRNIWAMNSDGSGNKQLTANASENIFPAATADGRYIVFSSNRAAPNAYNIWRMNGDGTNPVQLTFGSNIGVAPAVTPDGKWVIYASGGPDANIDARRLWKVSINGGEPIQLTDYATIRHDISPDGSSIACQFRHDKNSPWQIGIISISGGQPHKSFNVSSNVATSLRWTPDGRSITFAKTENEVSNIWAQPINGEPPQQLTKFAAETIQGFDWSDDNNLVCTRGYQARDPIMIGNFR